MAITLGLLLTNFGTTAQAAEKIDIKMCYNGPPDEKTNAVHLYAINFKRFVEARTDGRINITLYPNSQLGNEEQRMEQTMSGPFINIASYGGIAPVFSELFAANIPFMFDNYEAAHIYFDSSDFWKASKKELRKRTGVEMLEAVEEGGFLAFTNSKKEIRSPADFKGLKFRAMDESQVALYKAFGASGTPIPWTEVYMALKTGVADGQMNPPMYIIIGSLHEVQSYMTMANIQYSDQFLVINGEWLDSLDADLQAAIRKAAHDANVINRIEIETQVAERVRFIAQNDVKVTYPTKEAMAEFRRIGQPSYMEWLKKKIDQSWIDMSLADAEKANKKASQ
jgi:tripartite ATP-independent transporter DctP family solute receptor